MRWDTKLFRERTRRHLRQLRAVKTWQLVVLLFLGILISATFLRLNSLTMLELRHAVVSADEKGNQVEINTAIANLGGYVTRHMNTSLGDGFYLSSSYERVREAAIKAAADTADPNSKLYQEASVQCQSASARAPFGGYYVPCVQSKVRDLGGPSNIVSELKLPPQELYRIDFVSPVWSPDIAGISVAISAGIVLVIILRLTGVIVLRFLLKKRFSDIS